VIQAGVSYQTFESASTTFSLIILQMCKSGDQSDVKQSEANLQIEFSKT
jgi:hypothetical protein